MPVCDGDATERRSATQRFERIAWDRVVVRSRKTACLYAFRVAVARRRGAVSCRTPSMSCVRAWNYGDALPDALNPRRRCEWSCRPPGDTPRRLSSWKRLFRSREAVKGAPSARRRRRASPLDSLSASEHLVSKRKDGALCRSAAHVAAARRGAGKSSRKPLKTNHRVRNWRRPRSVRPSPRPPRKPPGVSIAGLLPPRCARGRNDDRNPPYRTLTGITSTDSRTSSPRP
jgi:hypothetical protein